VYAAVGLVLLAPLALTPAWSPRDLVWPAVFGYLGDARWASIYAVAAGATLLWTSTWWGTGLPWAGGVDPAAMPSGSVAGLGLVAWVVVGSWLVLGWRTVAVEAGAAAAGAGAVDNRRRSIPPAATLPAGAPQPGGEADARPWGEGGGDVRPWAGDGGDARAWAGDGGDARPGGGDGGDARPGGGGPGEPRQGGAHGRTAGAPNGSAPVPEGTRPSRGSLGVPK
jgi:hypothetical protein